MRSLFKIGLVAAALFVLAAPTHAIKVRPDEALNVARQWVRIIIHQQGAWGGSPTAEVTDVQEFKRNDRLVGYYCPVSPVGYVIVSLRRELEPVKAFSDSDSLDPASEEGMADLIKGGMERILSGIEGKVGEIERARKEDIEKMLEINYGPAWDEIESGVLLSEPVLSVGDTRGNYQQGQVLITSSWHQSDPYNRDCPPRDGCSHALVGCVATAGAQIMRYWSWPPYGVGAPYNDTYDWPNMLDSVTSSSPAASIAAVAELCAEVGQAVNMEYGCSGSSATTWDMCDVYTKTYRYSTDCNWYWRWPRTADTWWSMFKSQIDSNRPVQYRVPGHSILGDGWRETGQTPLRQYHMNYGWDNSRTAWYTLDALHLGDYWEEYMVTDIVPNVAVGSSPLGIYARDSVLPYRYFDKDVYCTNAAIFNAGQYFQTLPGIRIRCYNPGVLVLRGDSGLLSRLYTRGDTSKGARINNGAIRITAGGGIVLP